MKPALLLMMAAVCLTLAGDLTRINQTKPCSCCVLLTEFPLTQRGTDSGLNWNWSPQTSTHATGPDFKTPFYGKPSMPSPQQNLKPGVYKTSPYTLLVLVPGPQHDSGWFSRFGTNETEKIPVLQPGLKFIPYSFAQK